MWVIGLMSGTSCDGIDAALIKTDGEHILEFGKGTFLPYTQDFQRRLKSQFGKTEPDDDILTIEKELTYLHAQAVRNLGEHQAQLIGFHGQAIFHAPPFTWQIGDGALLEELTKISVIYNFRIDDTQKGGQGAPLVPIYHLALAKDLPKPLAIVNIGGVANVTLISSNDFEDLRAFDTGPGGGLLDDWILAKTGYSYDAHGKLAMTGVVHQSYVEKWLTDPYFSKSGPKALDRNHFIKCLKDIEALSIEDGAATLVEFTASSVAKATKAMPVIVTGGGRHNDYLLTRIKTLSQSDVTKTEQWGWDGDLMEAQAFAYLAARCFRGLSSSFSGTTGVSEPCLCGRMT